MQRQSLGSPSSKLHIHGCGGGGAAKDEIIKAEKDLIQSQNDEEADHKLLKPIRSFSSPSDKLIHLIPLLMLFCFLLLYLFSHDPSHSELAQFDGFKKRFSKLSDSSEIADMERFAVKTDVFSIRSLRNLQEIGGYASKSRLHRKMAGSFGPLQHLELRLARQLGKSYQMESGAFDECHPRAHASSILPLSSQDTHHN